MHAFEMGEKIKFIIVTPVFTQNSGSEKVMVIALVSVEKLFSVRKAPLRSAPGGSVFLHAFGFRLVEPNFVGA